MNNKWFHISTNPNKLTQLVVRVPKRIVKLATHRSLIKRLVRESYRLHKPTGYVAVNLRVSFLKQDRAIVRAELDKMMATLK